MSRNKKKSEETRENINPEEITEHDDETLVPLDSMTTGYTDEKTDQNADFSKGEEKESLTHAQALEEQKKIAADNLEKALRTQAELENLRKRTARDVENAHKYALEKFLGELLPVLDSMELGLSAVTETTADISSFKEGMELTHKMLVSLLEKYGVKLIDPAGEKFNPELHEAVSMLEHKEVASGHVINVMQKGYELNGRLVRPAMVVVAK